MVISKELQDKRTAVAVRFADPVYAINFIVDNNPRAVDELLRTKNIRSASTAETKAILLGFVNNPTPEGNAILAGVVNVPYLNETANYTGGLNGDPNAITLSSFDPTSILRGISDIACGIGSIFGSTGGCTQSNVANSGGITQAQLDAQAEALRAQQKANTTIIIAVVVILFIIIIATIILIQKKKSR